MIYCLQFLYFELPYRIDLLVEKISTGTCILQSIRSITWVAIRGSQRDVVYLGGPIAPSYISPNARGRGGSCGVSANEYSCTQEPK